MKSSLATRKLLSKRTPAAAVQGFSILQKPFHERRKPGRILGIVIPAQNLGRINSRYVKLTPHDRIRE
jgi:hypothetical protein